VINTRLGSIPESEHTNQGDVSVSYSQGIFFPFKQWGFYPIKDLKEGEPPPPRKGERRKRGRQLLLGIWRHLSGRGRATNQNIDQEFKRIVPRSPWACSRRHEDMNVESSCCIWQGTAKTHLNNTFILMQCHKGAIILRLRNYFITRQDPNETDKLWQTMASGREDTCGQNRPFVGHTMQEERVTVNLES
jgi:hypothetical protein